eukprot:SAG31_NODE_17103_length_683_cov_1.255137_1_plen_134_part_10
MMFGKLTEPSVTKSSSIARLCKVLKKYMPWVDVSSGYSAIPIITKNTRKIAPQTNISVKEFTARNVCLWSDRTRGCMSIISKGRIARAIGRAKNVNACKSNSTRIHVRATARWWNRTCLSAVVHLVFVIRMPQV